MKLWKFAHTVTLLSFLLAVLSAIFIDPILIITISCTGVIFLAAERIRNSEEKG